MSENINSLWQLFLYYRQSIGLGAVSALMCVMRHIQLKSDWRSTVSSAVMCGLLSFGIDGGLTEFFGMSGGSTYFLAVVIGYVGVDVIMSHLDFMRGFGGKDGN